MKDESPSFLLFGRGAFCLNYSKAVKSCVHAWIMCMDSDTMEFGI